VIALETNDIPRATRDRRITIRVTEEEAVQLESYMPRGGQLSTWARETLLRQPAVSHAADNRQPRREIDRDQVKNDFGFLFSFFQANASSLHVTSEQRARIAEILGRVKVL